MAMFVPALNKIEVYALLLVKTYFSKKGKNEKQNKQLVLSNTDRHK